MSNRTLINFRKQTRQRQTRACSKPSDMRNHFFLDYPRRTVKKTIAGRRSSMSNFIDTNPEEVWQLFVAGATIHRRICKTQSPVVSWNIC